MFLCFWKNTYFLFLDLSFDFIFSLFSIEESNEKTSSNNTSQIRDNETLLLQIEALQAQLEEQTKLAKEQVESLRQKLLERDRQIANFAMRSQAAAAAGSSQRQTAKAEDSLHTTAKKPKSISTNSTNSSNHSLTPHNTSSS